MNKINYNKYRIGLLVPEANICAEQDFHRMAPSQLNICTIRLGHKTWKATDGVKKNEDENITSHEDLWDSLNQNINRLVITKPDILSFACTSGSFVRGNLWEKKMRENIEKEIKIKMVTAAGAAVEAIKKLGLKNIIVVTEYAKTLNSLFKRFMRENGINIIKIVGTEEVSKYCPEYNIKDWTVNTPASSEIAYKMIEGINTQDSEGIFISGTGFGVIDIINTVEKTFKKPVATSNQALFWSSIRKIGIKESIPNYGKLLTKSYN